jgi:hypothetical protein
MPSSAAEPPIDVRKVIEIGYSTLHQVLACVLNLAIAAACMAQLFHFASDLLHFFRRPIEPGSLPGSLKEVGTVFGAAIFGAAGVAMFWRALKQPSTIITLSPLGLRDVRLAADLIPWNAVRGVSMVSHVGLKTLIVDIDPAVLQRLGPTHKALSMRRLNQAAGISGVSMETSTLSVSRAWLETAVTAYAMAYGRAEGITAPSSR